MTWKEIWNFTYGKCANCDSRNWQREKTGLLKSGFRKVPTYSRKCLSCNKYNVEKWCNDATKIIHEIFQRNLNPILVGGTGLYAHTLINGLINIPTIPESIKNESENNAANPVE